MKNKLFVVQGLDTWYPDVCGPQIVAENYCSILRKNGNSCRLIVPSFGGKIDRSIKKRFNFPISRVPSMYVMGGYREALPLIDKNLRFLNRDKVDIFHSHSPFAIGEYFSKVGQKRNIPTVMTFHTKFKDEFMRITKSKLISQALVDMVVRSFKNTDYVWTVSNGAKQTLLDYGYKGEITVLRNGTDLTMPSNPDELIRAVNEKYNLQDKKNVLLFVGRIVEVKNLPLVFNALSILKQRGIDFTLIIVGDGTAMDSLKQLACELKIENSIIFTGMITDREFLKGFYLRSDLFLFPSVFDTASLVPIEAATFSLPTLLVTDSPTSEIITDGVNGFAAPDDKGDWADKLGDILTNKDKLQLAATNCHQTVYRTWQKCVDEAESNYRKILGK